MKTLVYRTVEMGVEDITATAFALTTNPTAKDLVVTAANVKDFINKEDNEWWYWQGDTLKRAKYGKPNTTAGQEVKAAMDNILQS